MVMAGVGGANSTNRVTVNETMSPSKLSPPTVSLPNTETMDPSSVPFLGEEDEYDYKGALLFVVGLLSVYGVAILLLIVSLIRKSRSALEVKDHLRDFEAMRRASQKRSLRMSRENSERLAGLAAARHSLSGRGNRTEIEHQLPERFSICSTVNEEEAEDSVGEEAKSVTEETTPQQEEKVTVSVSSARRAPLVSPVISALRATEEHGTVAL